MEERQTIAVTGASTGIGRALAIEFASPDTSLFLCARRKSLLEETANECRDKGALVYTNLVDLRDDSSMEKWIEEIHKHAPLNTMIFNAGVFGGSPHAGELEDSASAESIIRTNLTAPILGSLAIARSMISRKCGHLVYISSLAAYAPQADAPTYSASKAGLTTFGKAFREFLHEFGIKVTLVHPGHVLTFQAELQKGPLPFLTTKEDAVKRIAAGIRSGQSDISFPLVPRILIFLLGLLPWKVQAWFNRPYRFQVSDEIVEQTKNVNPGKRSKL